VFNIGPLELLVVLIIALVVLGPQRLPDVARSVGRGMREFRSALENPDRDEDDHAAGVPLDEPEPYQKEADSSEPSSSSRDLV
jgi:sec-independent protein translocase protein TatA